jgi:hypothetical protein
MISFFKRLPIIRHLRWIYHSYRVEQHYAFWAEMGYLPVNREIDDAQLDRIWRGAA